MLHGPEVKPATAPACPHCSSGAVCGHGSFPLKDGTRQKRYRCRDCGRTFNQLTGTPLTYLKKRDQWPRFLDGMIDGWSLRLAADQLGLHLSTTFRWRHRLLAPLTGQTQPVLPGLVMASEAFVPYSEKGSRKTSGPGAWGSRAARKQGAPGARPFPRFVEAKPSCVLLANAGTAHAVVTIGRGQPRAEQLCESLKQILGAGAELLALGCVPYELACRRLGVTTAAGGDNLSLLPKAHRLSRAFQAWLGSFRGVATRYLEHYQTWYRLVRIPAARRAGPRCSR